MWRYRKHPVHGAEGSTALAGVSLSYRWENFTRRTLVDLRSCVLINPSKNDRDDAAHFDIASAVRGGF
jgi:hypothetical protein